MGVGLLVCVGVCICVYVSMVVVWMTHNTHTHHHMTDSSTHRPPLTLQMEARNLQIDSLAHRNQILVWKMARVRLFVCLFIYIYTPTH